jgi:hypothetical protein
VSSIRVLAARERLVIERSTRRRVAAVTPVGPAVGTPLPDAVPAPSAAPEGSFTRDVTREV